MQRQVSSLALAMALCACTMASLPENSREGEVTQLVSLLGKLKNMERARQKQQQQYLSGVDLTSRHIASSFPSSSLSSSSSSSSAASDATFKALASEMNAYPQSSDAIFLPQRDLDLGDDFSDIEETLRKRGRSNMPSAVSAADIGRPNKRQGSWSYDYGLGGGRFGKRNYGDYGIGGGRFGRDVDHVDISDPHEGDLATL